MPLNSNIVLYGYHVALLPFAERHVSKRHEWMQRKENWPPYQKEPTSYDVEHRRWQQLQRMEKTVSFMIADVEKLVALSTTQNESLVGDATISVNEFGVGELEYLLTETSVRRKKFMSESMLLILQYASSVLKLRQLVVHPGSTAQNRLIFITREDAMNIAVDLPLPKPGDAGDDVGEDSPAMRRKSSVASIGSKPRSNSLHSLTVPDLDENKARVSSGGKTRSKGQQPEQTNYLQRLTAHLFKSDEGSHWPSKLDFVLAGPNRLELSINDEVAAALSSQVAHARFIKYSSMSGDNILRTSANTRVNGINLTLVPYRREHVTKVWPMMQQQDMHIRFGVSPPTFEEEVAAQVRMEHNEDCFAFVVCSQDRPGEADCPMSPVGRAQIIRNDVTALMFLGIAVPDVNLRADMAREAFLMLLHIAHAMLVVDKVQAMPDVVVRGKKSDTKHWKAVTNFTPVPDSNLVELSLKNPEVQKALTLLCSPFRICAFDKEDAKYVDASAV